MMNDDKTESNEADSLESLHIPGLDWNSTDDLSASAYRQDDSRMREARLKVLPQHGFCLWPEDGHDWIHPNDLAVAKSLLPSKRIFRKQDCTDPVLEKIGYCEYTYGAVSFRGLPTLWHEVESDGFELGDTVELKSNYGKLRPIIGQLVGMYWNRHIQKIEYEIEKNRVLQPNRFHAEQFRLCMKIGVSPNPRQQALLNRDQSLNGL